MSKSTSSVQRVGDLMTGDLVSLGPLDSMGRARMILTESGLHAIPIIDEDQPFGMVTLADCRGRRADELLGDVMAGPPVTIDIDATPSEAAALMRSQYVHHLLVTEGDSRSVVGMLSTYDLLATLID